MRKTKAPDKAGLLIVIFLVIVIGYIFVVGFMKYRHVQSLTENCTATTSGLVTMVDRTEKHSDVGGTWVKIYHIEADFYVNSIRYTAVADERRGENDYGENARFKTNTTVTIMYNPSDPNESYIKAAAMDNGKREMLSAVLIPVVFIFLAIDYRRKKRRENDM